jgi:signal transduction histidine kinase
MLVAPHQSVKEPRVSIKRKLLLTLGVGLAFITLLGLLYYYNLVTIRRRLLLVEGMDDLGAAVGEVRRAEKNYLLYHDSASAYELADQIRLLRQAVRDKTPDLISLAGADSVNSLQREIAQYATLAGSLMGGEEAAGDADRLRETGQALDRSSRSIVRAERGRIEKMIRTSHRTLLLSLIVLLICGAAGILIVTRLIVAPLRRIERATRDVSEGRFSPIRGIQGHDEIGRLADAFNHMVHRIEKHQNELVQAGKLASLGTLTSGVAHELNNPLNNISMMAQTFIQHRASLTEAEQVELMEEIERQCERSKEIVHNLLDFSRVRGTDRVAADVGQVVVRSLKLVQNQLDVAGIVADMRTADALPLVRMNPHQIEQVLVNIFTNAIKAMPHGGVLRVESGPGKGGQHVVVAVSDTGVGIAPELHPRVFDPFFTTSDVGGGTGLGLSVSYGIIKRHGGTISVASEPGKGSTFTITLPIDTGGSDDERDPQDPGGGR